MHVSYNEYILVTFLKILLLCMVIIQFSELFTIFYLWIFGRRVPIWDLICNFATLIIFLSNRPKCPNCPTKYTSNATTYYKKVLLT
jgi:hypothetical protein